MKRAIAITWFILVGAGLIALAIQSPVFGGVLAAITFVAMSVWSSMVLFQ